jgi:hypothetical protein
MVYFSIGKALLEGGSDGAQFLICIFYKQVTPPESVNILLLAPAELPVYRKSG